jgi:hypothetical protein
MVCLLPPTNWPLTYHFSIVLFGSQVRTMTSPVRPPQAPVPRGPFIPSPLPSTTSVFPHLPVHLALHPLMASLLLAAGRSPLTSPLPFPYFLPTQSSLPQPRAALPSDLTPRWQETTTQLSLPQDLPPPRQAKMDINFLTSPTASLAKSEPSGDQDDLTFARVNGHYWANEDEDESEASSPISSPCSSCLGPSPGQESPIRRESHACKAALNLKPLQAKELWQEKEAEASIKHRHKGTEVHETTTVTFASRQY